MHCLVLLVPELPVQRARVVPFTRIERIYFYMTRHDDGGRVACQTSLLLYWNLHFAALLQAWSPDTGQLMLLSCPR